MTTQAAACTGALSEAQSTGLVTRILHPAITTDVSSFEAAAHAAERVAVQLEAPGPERRTQLAEFVLSSIEAQLERLGAAPRGWTARDSLEMVLSDQLYRSRLLGAGGIALKFAALDGIADASGGLSLEDSHALRRMFDLAELEPLQVFLPEPSAGLCVAGPPRPLAEWLPSSSRAGTLASIEYESSVPVATANLAPGAHDGLAPPRVEAFVCSPGTSTAFTTDPAEHAKARPLAAAPPSELGETGAATVAPGCARDAQPTPGWAVPPTRLDAEAADCAEPPGAASVEDSASLRASPVPEAAARELATDSRESALGSEEPALAPEEQEERKRRCASWLAQLQSMNGRKQHSSVERAFLTAYVPLSREVAMGRAPEEARSAVETWAEGFAQSYASAFKTLTSHARRPTMVRDIFDLGQRWLNQFRARSFQLLLIDGMRFDLGQRLNEVIEARLAGRAVCRDQALLWAALPSNSVAQRLADSGASRSPQAGKPGEPSGSGSGAAGEVEALRVGSRELFRLDQLGADLARPGEVSAQRLDRLAILLADAVVPWLEARAPDSLIVVFGDHGFHWQASRTGTSAAQRGGALPEQVLVPASAWLVGTVRPKAGTAAGLH